MVYIGRFEILATREKRLLCAPFGMGVPLPSSMPLERKLTNKKMRATVPRAKSSHIPGT